MADNKNADGNVSQTGEYSCIFDLRRQQENPSNDTKVAPAHSEKPNKWSEIELKDRLVIELTAGIFIVAALTAYLFLTQATIMQNQLIEMRGAGQQVDRQIIVTQGQMVHAGHEAENTKVMADSSKKSIEATQDAMRLDQRAWISIINLHLSKELTAGENVGITFTVPNSGKTPAINVSAKYVIDIKPTEPPIPNWASLKKYNQEVVFPNSNIAAVQATASGITQPIMNSYSTHTTRLYIRARIDYTDVFGMPHWTEICSSHQFGDSIDSFEGCPIGAEIDPTIKNHQERK